SEESALAGAQLAWLDLTHPASGARVQGRGEMTLEQRVPFELALEYARDDRLRGRARFSGYDSTPAVPHSLVLRRDPAASQERRRGELRLGGESRLWAGRIPVKIGGRRPRRGPQLAVMLSAGGLTQPLIESSVPAPLLGPLTDLSIEGSFDYKLKLDLD